MPASPTLVNSTASALSISRASARFMGELEYNINQCEAINGPTIFVEIQTLIDKINEIKTARRKGAVKGTGLLKRADDVEWDTSRSSTSPAGVEQESRLELARMLGVEHLLSSNSGNTIRILR